MTWHHAFAALFVLWMWRRWHRDRVKWRKQQSESRLLKQAAERFSEGKR